MLTHAHGSRFAYRASSWLVAVAIATGSSAEVIYVDTGAPAAGDGGSWAGAYQDLQAGLAASQDGDEIWVAAGEYLPTIGIDRSATFQLVSGVALYGGFPADGGDGTFAARDPLAHVTVLSGDLAGNDVGLPTDATRADNSYHVVTSSGVDATARLDGFTISGGNGDGTGGSYTNQGAGILNLGGSPVIVDCTISGCIATYGGGMLSTGTSNPVLIGCTIAANVATSQAGGIYSSTGSNPTVINGRFLRNTSLGVAGGMYVRFDATLTNCVFFGNVAATNGGGLYAISGRPVVTNCTFGGNDAGSGGAMYAASGGSAQTSTLGNCIAWGNTPDQLVEGGNSIDVSYSNVQGGWAPGGTGNIDSDPMFADALTGDLHLLPGSPSIDTGFDDLVPLDTTDLDGDLDTSEPIPFDFDGYGRFADGDGGTTPIVDMGAYERPGDSDGDGLLDVDEIVFGTDPNDPDTDDDGLLDGTEVSMAEGSGCPDPLVADSDSDTLLDGDEVDGCTNPCNADTDDDGIPDDLDPFPLDPEGTIECLEEASRSLADTIRGLDLALFNGPNDNANRGRRNALANRATSAANKIADGDLESAIDSLTSLLQKIDGESPPPDWMHDSPEKTALADELDFLIVLLELLVG